MIKHLFFMAGLLVPILAFGANPSAPFSDQVVPATQPPPDPPPPPSPGSIACDVGPNVSSIPAPAQAAGFTHCYLNMDFTQNVTDKNGVNFQNVNTWLWECGANGGNPINTTYFHYMLAQYDSSGNGYVRNTSCSDASNVINDSGTTVYYLNNSHPLQVKYGGQGGYTALNWPSCGWGACGATGGNLPAGGPRGLGLSQLYYVEFTVREPTSNFQNWGDSAGHTDGSDTDFWTNICFGCGSYNSSGTNSQQDFFEGHVADFNFSTGKMSWGSFACTNYCNNNIDITNYHTYAYLRTQSSTDTDGSTYNDCLYIDGVLTQSPCVSDQKFNGPLNSFGLIFALWAPFDHCYGDNSKPPLPCMQGSFTHGPYIKSIRFFSCANMWNSTCFGPVVSGELDNGRSFAWLRGLTRKAKVWLSSLSLFSPAAAQSSDGMNFLHSDGQWWCKATGRFEIDSCAPNFAETEFWKVCVPGRTDCLWSPTAFTGWRVGKPEEQRQLSRTHFATRGPGYCYREQPYTCSPDGKVPQ